MDDAECAAIMDIVRVRRLASDATCRRGRALLIPVVQMATRLVQRMVADAERARG